MFKSKLGSILVTFETMLTRLEDFISKTSEDLSKNEIKIVLLNNKKKDMKKDIEKADKVHSNVRRILGENGE